jgi:predicted DNA-binding transcriptional regulator AlpA
MSRRRLSSRKSRRFEHDGQLSLEIEPTAHARSDQCAPLPRTRVNSHKRTPELEPIMWMRDVVLLTDTHRSTIHRWVRSGFFPAKDAPRDHPRGWLRSTIERWQLGACGRHKRN